MARPEKQLLRQHDALQRLLRNRVLHTEDQNAAFQAACVPGAQVLGVERTSVWLVHPERILRCEAAYEQSTGAFASGEELQAAQAQRYFRELAGAGLVAVDDAQADPRVSELVVCGGIPPNVGALLDAPILICGELRGVVCHRHVGSTRTWSRLSSCSLRRVQTSRPSGSRHSN